MGEINIKPSIGNIYRQIKSHIGSGSDAHLNATPFNNGFLSAEDKVKYDSASGKRIYLAAGVDVLSLDEGQYEGFNFVNGPLSSTDASFLAISVEIGEHYGGDRTKYTRKQLTAIRSHDGKRFERTIHQSGVDMGWRIIEQKTSLWSGSASKVGVVIPLAEARSKFSYFELEYTDTKTGIRNEKFPIKNDLSLNTMNIANRVGSGIVEFLEMRVTISNAGLTIAHNRRITTDFTKTSAPTISEEAEMTILNVWGVV